MCGSMCSELCVRVCGVVYLREYGAACERVCRGV